MIGKPSSFWAKLSTREIDTQLEWHPLEAHCADVAACCEALLNRGLTGTRLANLGGIGKLSAQQIARLCVLAGLHDIGKFNHGFQAKSGPMATLTAGHVGEMLGLLESSEDWIEKFIRAVNYERMVNWAEDEQTLFSYLRAVISHHGRPGEAKIFQRALWKPRMGQDPFTGIAALRDSLERWFPVAWEEGGDMLPTTPAFQHAFYGLLTLADWIASDTRFFPFAAKDDGDRFAFARGKARKAMSTLWLDPGSETRTLCQRSFVNAVLPGLVPRPLQQSVLDLDLPDPGSVTVLEAETGAGKTEAALLHFLNLFNAGLVDGLYFALPTRTAATQIHQRVADAVKRIFVTREDRPPVVMAVPGYLKVDDVEGHKLASFEVLWNDDKGERYRFLGWAAENPKRYLAGAIVVGTIDQVLLSALQVNHSHMRAAALLRHLLVVDEVHASDLYMSRLLKVVLERHIKAGGHAFLMSATLGSEVRECLLCETLNPSASSISAAIQTPYPLLVQRSATGKSITLPIVRLDGNKPVELDLQPLVELPEPVASLALNAAERGARVLVLRNTVSACLETQQSLEQLAEQKGLTSLLHRIGDMPTPHHSRYARVDRKVLDKAIEDHFGKQRPDGGRVAVTTQTVQQSLDLDADLLITDLCPMDILLQRVGRLHRHVRKRPAGFENARAVVLTPSDRDLSPRIHEKTGAARGANGLGTVYNDLRIIEATWRQLEKSTRVHIPDDNRALVEATVHSKALQTLVAELGGVWLQHDQHILGTGIANKINAGFNTANWTVDFTGQEVHFGHGADEMIKTRLGEGDRRIVFDEPFTGPFGESIGELTIPHWQARHIDVDVTPSNLSLAHGYARFSLGAAHFLYDRLGLRRDNEVDRKTEEG